MAKNNVYHWTTFQRTNGVYKNHLGYNQCLDNNNYFMWSSRFVFNFIYEYILQNVYVYCHFWK